MDVDTFNALREIYRANRPHMISAPQPASPGNINDLVEAFLSSLFNETVAVVVREAGAMVERHSRGKGLPPLGRMLEPEMIETLKGWIEARRDYPRQDVVNLALAFVASALCETLNNDPDILGSSPFSGWLTLPLAREIASYQCYSQMTEMREAERSNV